MMLFKHSGLVNHARFNQGFYFWRGHGYAMAAINYILGLIMEAYVKIYNQRLRVEHKHKPLNNHLRGLPWSVSGYGKRIPTEHMVRFNGKWRRVYCCQFSNSGTCYIGKLSENFIVDFY